MKSNAEAPRWGRFFDAVGIGIGAVLAGIPEG